VFADELHRVLHVSLWLKALAILALTEVSFTWGHSLMHKVPALAELHVMHHCCTHVSMLTNLLFNPLDIYLEFGGGSLVIYGGHFLVFRDQFLLLFTYTLFQLWYMYDHDEGLQ
jgi:sterol desaturase/sphingolipid hydroxylase (fatty acid hydroxylase superfamily)